MTVNKRNSSTLCRLQSECQTVLRNEMNSDASFLSFVEYVEQSDVPSFLFSFTEASGRFTFLFECSVSFVFRLSFDSYLHFKIIQA